MKRYLRQCLWAALIGSCLGLPAIWVGCASLTPGADPLVVRVEQSESGATATFDFVLNEDNANRPFWQTNAPAFHKFVEWLRTPTPYVNGTNYPRCVVLQLNVDDLKLRYQAAKSASNSNLLVSVVSALEAALSQAASWENIATNSIHP